MKTYKKKLSALLLCTALLGGYALPGVTVIATASEKNDQTQEYSKFISGEETGIINEELELPTDIQTNEEQLELTVEKETVQENSTPLGESTTDVSEIQNRAIVTGIWGDVSWEFNESIGELTFTSVGTLGFTSDSPWNVYKSALKRESIEKIVFTTNVKAPKDSAFLFTDFNYYIEDYALSNLTSIDNLNYLDTSDTTNMQGMFIGIPSLTSLDVSGFDTSNVTNMYQMFSDNTSLTSLDVSGFDTSNVTNMNSMFSDNTSLTSLDVSGFDTSNVTDMSGMFADVSSLTSLDVSGFDTSNVTNMRSMFSRNLSLTSLDVSNFDTSNVTDMYGMFMTNQSLTSLDVSDFDTSNVTNMYQMFTNTSSLTSLDVSNFDTSKVTSMFSMFGGTSSLTSLDVSNFDTSKVIVMQAMFSNSGVTSLDLSNFDMTNVSNQLSMLRETSSLKEITLNNTFRDPRNTSSLPAVPVNSQYTGNWMKKDGEIVGDTSNFLANLSTTGAGTYIWETKSTLNDYVIINPATPERILVNADGTLKDVIMDMTFEWLNPNVSNMLDMTFVIPEGQESTFTGVKELDSEHYTISEDGKTIRVIIDEELKGLSLELSMTGNGEFVIKTEVGYGNDMLNEMIFGESTLATNIKSVLIGDVNDDGKVSIADLALLKSYLNTNTLSSNVDAELFMFAADINGDGRVNIVDQALLKRLLN